MKGKHIININETIVRKLNLIQFKNSLSNIFFKDIRTYYNLKKDLNRYKKELKHNLLEEYNNKCNNVLSNDAKLIANRRFFQMINSQRSDSIITFFSKELIAVNVVELFEIVKNARPFKNQLNYSFHRSATKKDVDMRISFMKVCSPDGVVKTKKPAVFKQQGLVDKFKEFLYDYFGYKKGDVK